MVVWRDLLSGEGPFPIQARDWVVLTGDLNMVGYRRQLDVLLHGTFIDPDNGPDFSPGRAKESLKSAKLRHTHARSTVTWRQETSTYAPGKLDYIIYSKDVARLKRNYVLDTAEMPDDVLAAAGLERTDSLAASDHLAMVADFKIKKK